MIKWTARATLATLVLLPSLTLHVYVRHPLLPGMSHHPLLGVLVLATLAMVAVAWGILIALLFMVAAAVGEFDR